MTDDLDARIRARLDDPKRYMENGVEPLIDALTAVLELKRRNGEDWTHFSETAYELGQRSALERAVEVIVEALGVDDA